MHRNQNTQYFPRPANAQVLGDSEEVLFLFFNHISFLRVCDKLQGQKQLKEEQGLGGSQSEGVVHCGRVIKAAGDEAASNWSRYPHAVNRLSAVHSWAACFYAIQDPNPENSAALPYGVCPLSYPSQGNPSQA